ncbi:MAG: aspartate/glutamate racemase family protein [Victivallaceae bacterium]|nr:aspartate/glutamate racemase family protein [Victivallaceae bacterium]
MMTAKRIVFCDSGVGGADMAADFVDAIRGGAAFPKIEVVLFNAWLRPGIGFNQLPTRESKERAFAAVLKGVARFSPDRMVFACNTLSTILYRAPHLRELLPCPAAEMLFPAADFLARKLAEEPEAAMLLCGTATTVSGGVYEMLLRAHGIAGKRLIPLACPGLATQIEYAPDGAVVYRMLRRLAQSAAERFPSAPKKVLTALCCTHFGYSRLWREAFSAVFGDVETVNPNRAAVDAILPEWRGRYRPEISVRFHTRVDFPGIKTDALSPCFAGRAPEVIGALARPERDAGLFTF